jgi:Ni,Fe-hydrogenase I cytochrome b subunit
MSRFLKLNLGLYPLLFIAKVLGGLIMLVTGYSLTLAFLAFSAPVPSFSAEAETIAAYTQLLHLRRDYIFSIFDNLASKILIPLFALVLGAILSR